MAKDSLIAVVSHRLEEIEVRHVVVPMDLEPSLEIVPVEAGRTKFTVFGAIECSAGFGLENVAIPHDSLLRELSLPMGKAAIVDVTTDSCLLPALAHLEAVLPRHATVFIVGPLLLVRHFIVIVRRVVITIIVVRVKALTRVNIGEWRRALYVLHLRLFGGYKSHNEWFRCGAEGVGGSLGRLRHDFKVQIVVWLHLRLNGMVIGESTVQDRGVWRTYDLGVL